MIFLYGHPRCGKTTLMHQFGSYHVIDLDEFMLELQNEYGSIGEVYAENPQCFYDLEAKALRLALEQKPCVISLGGGTLLRNTVSGKVIYLQQSLQVLRLRWQKDRPLTQMFADDAFYEERHLHYLHVSSLLWDNPLMWRDDLANLLNDEPKT